jgi:hypothetical protein
VARHRRKKEWLGRGAEQKTSRCLKSVHFCNIKQHSMIGMGLSFLAGTARYHFLFVLLAKSERQDFTCLSAVSTQVKV